MSDSQQEAEARYWFAEESELDRSLAVLESMRVYRAAESAMQRRTQRSMGMGENDLLALRYVIRGQRDGRSIGPKELTQYLGISSASTTVLLDRLERAGELRRENSPFDRRALILIPTATSDEEISAALGEVPERMVEIANALSSDEARIVIRFMEQMRAAVDEIDANPAGGSSASRS